MLFFVKGHVKEPEGLSADELENPVHKKLEELQALKNTGKLIAAYRASEGQERMGIANVESRDALDQAITDLPTAPYLRWEAILPGLEL